MAKIENFQDLTIRWDGHQKYKSGKIIEDKLIEVIVQKLEMLLYTTKGEVLGQDSDGFGVNLEYYLWQTTVANDILKGEIQKQINAWVPELNVIGFDLNIDIFEGTVRDIMQVNFVINGYNVQFIFQ